MSLALARSSRSSSLQRTLHSSSKATFEFEQPMDREVREAIQAVALSKKKFAALDVWTRQIMNLPSRSKARNWLTGRLYSLVPNSFRQNLPDFVVKMIAEEFDALEAGERRYRTIINDTQAGVKIIVSATNRKGEHLDVLMADIERARAENWDARKFHEYIFENAGIKIDPDISTLLDDKFNVLSPEEKEAMRQRLLGELEGNVVVGRSTVDLAVRSCFACLEVLETMGVGFYNFVHNYKLAAALRDAAISIIEGGTVMHGSKEAIMATYRVSLEAIDSALEAARRCRENSLVSADMVKLLETGRTDIDDKIRSIASGDKKRLAEINVIDVEPASAPVN